MYLSGIRFSHCLHTHAEVWEWHTVQTKTWQSLLSCEMQVLGVQSSFSVCIPFLYDLYMYRRSWFIYVPLFSIPDPIHAITSNDSLESNENSSVTLTCAFFKDPDDPDPFPPVNWTGPSYRSIENATQLSYDMYESSITFEVNRAHYGRFTCSVNDDGVGIQYEIIDLKVYCKYTGCIIRLPLFIYY